MSWDKTTDSSFSVQRCHSSWEPISKSDSSINAGMPSKVIVDQISGKVITAVSQDHSLVSSEIEEADSSEEEDDSSDYSEVTDYAARPSRPKRARKSRDTPRPLLVPKKNKQNGGPTPEQIQKWKTEVGIKLSDDEKKDNIMLSMAMSCRSSRKLTVWEKLISPFFVAACAIETNPFQFVINTSNADVMTIPPNRLWGGLDREA